MNRKASNTKLVKGSHSFAIKAYTLQKGMGVGKFIASDTFTVGGYQWAIYFYPDGKHQEAAGYVSVFIALVSEGSDVKSLFELKIVDQSGKGMHKVLTHFHRIPKCKPCTLRYYGSMWGYNRCIQRDLLETSDFLKEDSLKIDCTVGVVVPAAPRSALHSLQGGEIKSAAGFAMSLENEESSDVTFHVAGEIFHARKASCKFVLKEYSRSKGMGSGNQVTSGTFSVGGYQWAIYFYPDGKNHEDSKYISVFIALVSEGSDVKALFELMFLDQSGKGKHKVHSHFQRTPKSKPYTLKYRGSMWGYKHYFRRAALKTSDFLKDDCLKINCSVGVVVPPVRCSILHSSILEVGETDVVDSGFGKLLKNEESSDVTFHVAGEIFHAHKLVLTSRSPILASKFFDKTEIEESKQQIVITDVEPKVFKVILNFIYRDILSVDVDKEGSPSLSESLAGKVLAAAADNYGLEKLKLLCEAHLCKDISVSNVAEILALANQYQANELKAVCFSFAAENLAAVMQSYGFECLRQSFPALASELLNASGYDEVARDLGKLGIS